MQYMPNSNDKAKEYLQQRRFLAVGYGDEKQSKDEEKEMTEEEWLEKEKKEIEEVEKTVNIRFANYTTLMRAQTLTQGLSAQLAMFLSNMGPNSGASTATSLLAKQKESDDAFNKKLLEKAGIKTEEDDEEKKDQPMNRSLSPMATELPSEKPAEGKESGASGITVTKKEISTDN